MQGCCHSCAEQPEVALKAEHSAPLAEALNSLQASTKRLGKEIREKKDKKKSFNDFLFSF